MRDVPNPLATTLEHFALGLDACNNPPRVPVNTVMCDLVEPVLSCGHNAVKATELTCASLVPPVLQLTLPLACTPWRIP
jgi:hypothetical protein